MNDIGMINDGMKKMLETQRIEWVNGPNFWVPLLFALLFFTFILAVAFINAPITFSLFMMLLYIFILIQTLLIPKIVVIDADILMIFLIGRTMSIRKSEIEKIKAFKLKGSPGQLYYFKIFSKRPISSKFCYEMLPFLIPYELKPYHNLEPSRIYDIVEEIKNWFDKDYSQNIKAG